MLALSACSFRALDNLVVTTALPAHQGLAAQQPLEASTEIAAPSPAEEIGGTEAARKWADTTVTSDLKQNGGRRF